MIKTVRVNFKREVVIVKLIDDKFRAAYLPGDYMEITDKLSIKEKGMLERRARVRLFNMEAIK